MTTASKVRRLLHLVELLQSGRSYNTRQLAESCRISRRQVFRDLRALQDSGVPVIYDSSRQGYRLAETTYLPPTDLTLEETLSLLALAHGLGRNREGIPFQRPARNAALKLLSSLPGRLRAHIGELVDEIDVQTDAHHPHSRDEAHYHLLLQSLREKRRVRLHYHSLHERDDISTLLSPYRLLFFRRAWYVVGRSSLHRAIRTFHVGRILSAEPTDDEYKIPQRFRLDRYFGNAWRLIREQGRSKQVVVRFQPLVAENVAEVAWHHTQRIDWNDDGTLDFHVRVDGLSEISWWILGYGDQAEVLKPAELRELIADRVDRMAAVYRTRAGKKN